MRMDCCSTDLASCSRSRLLSLLCCCDQCPCAVFLCCLLQPLVGSSDISHLLTWATLGLSFNDASSCCSPVWGIHLAAHHWGHLSNVLIDLWCVFWMVEETTCTIQQPEAGLGMQSPMHVPASALSISSFELLITPVGYDWLAGRKCLLLTSWDLPDFAGLWLGPPSLQPS